MDRAHQLTGRHILITGAASGIGRATAALFAEQGAATALLDVQAEALATAAAETGASWHRAVDLLDRAATAAAVVDAAESMGGLDGLVNCAGLAGSSPLDDLDEDTWDRIMGVNLHAPYVVCRAALPDLRRRPGATIVNIASGQALLPNAPGATAYAGSKAGVTAFTKALAAELAPFIRANVVCPGIVETPMTSFLLEGYDDPSDAPFVQQYRMGRVAQPSEIAEAILFLTSDASSYVTAAAFAIDGGRTFH
jgi:NAD(P)-dependent dehydrogenase (short-subunit alcohol dehydrogenase family)